MKIDTNWFLHNSIPADAIRVSYHTSIVFLALLFGVVAALLIAYLIGRLQDESNPKINRYWMLGGALATGIGIWATNFISILSWNIPTQISFDELWIIISLIFSIIFSLLSLWVLQYNLFSKNKKIILSGLLLGAGINLTYYTAMQGMELHIEIVYTTKIFFASIIATILINIFAYLLLINNRLSTLSKKLFLKTFGIIALTSAMIGTHYAGLFNAVVTLQKTRIEPILGSIERDDVALSITMISGSIIGILFAIALYRHFILFGKKEVEKHEAGFGKLSKAARALEPELHRAIKKNELVLFYQPITDCKNEKKAGYEALLYWKHPEKGIMSPGVFLPLAEATGLIIPMGTWVLETACKQIQSWQNTDQSHLFISVNLSRQQFNQPNLTKIIIQTIQNTNTPPEKIKLEITETLLMSNVKEYIVTLNQLRDHGVRFSLDDFGTGYSSLSYLKQFPLDSIKIDKSFIDDIAISEDSLAIVTAIIALSKSLGLKTIAEGVETRAQLDILKKLGCDFIQGYLFGRPEPL